MDRRNDLHCLTPVLGVLPAVLGQFSVCGRSCLRLLALCDSFELLHCKNLQLPSPKSLHHHIKLDLVFSLLLLVLLTLGVHVIKVHPLGSEFLCINLRLPAVFSGLPQSCGHWLWPLSASLRRGERRRLNLLLLRHR